MEDAPPMRPVFVTAAGEGQSAHWNAQADMITLVMDMEFVMRMQFVYVMNPAVTTDMIAVALAKGESTIFFVLVPQEDSVQILEFVLVASAGEVEPVRSNVKEGLIQMAMSVLGMEFVSTSPIQLSALIQETVNVNLAIVNKIAPVNVMVVPHPPALIMVSALPQERVTALQAWTI